MFIGTAQCFESVFHTRNNGFGKPLHIIFIRIHGFAQTHQQAHVGVLFDECRNRLTGVVADERRDGTVTILRFQSVMIGKRFRQENIVEHLNHKDTALVGLLGQEREYLFVLFKGSLIDLQCKRILLELHQRSKRVTVPQV